MSSTHPVLQTLSELMQLQGRVAHEVAATRSIKEGSILNDLNVRLLQRVQDWCNRWGITLADENRDSDLHYWVEGRNIERIRF